MKSDKKIAVITGSAGGLGKEFAQRLLRSGNLQFNDLLFYLGYLIQLHLATQLHLVTRIVLVICSKRCIVKRKK